jgi:DNA-directed RNA polymerase specialized sigma24 family protein
MSIAADNADLFAPDGLATRCIRRKAAAMLGWVGFTRLDAEDIEQELTLAVIQRLPKYDQTRSRMITYISSVVRVAALALIRRRRTAKRNHGRKPVSLDAPRQPGRSRTLTRAQSTGQAQARRHRKIATRSEVETVAMQHDVAVAVAALEPDLASVCSDLMSGRRRQVSNECRDQIQERFRQAGIDSYL